MRKTIFWVFGIVAVVVLLAKSSDIATLFETVSRGALIPIVAAAVFQLGKYMMQSVSLAAAFDAVGEDASWRRMIPLVFSGIFINTIAPTGGTASAVLIIDDARRRGISPGKATSAALVAQMGAYSGFIIIMIMGFIILQMTGRLDPTAFLGGMVLVVAVAFFAGILFVCRKNKELLYSLLAPVERAGEKIFVKFRRPAPKPWAENLITSFSAASDSIATNPMVALSVLGFSTLASGLEMLGFVSVGFAFGLTAVNELIAAYVVTNIFTIVSPSPNGVGFAEAAATLVLTSYGTPATISTAIALVFRGFVFWVPFAVGALLLRRTGFFSKKKDETEEEKALQTGYLAGLFIFVFGLANVVFAIVPVMPSAYELLTTWFSVGNVFSGTWAVILGIMLILMTRGMIRRSRTTWAWVMVLLILLAVAQLMSAKTYYVALAILILAAWLFRERSSFDRLLVHESMRSTVIPILLAILIIIGYGLCGFFILQGDFESEFGVFSPFAAIAQTLVPFFEDPAALSDHAKWFVESLRTIAVVTAFWAVIATIFPWLRKKYRADTAEKISVVKRLEPYATISVDEAEILEEYEQALGRNSAILDGDMTIPEEEISTTEEEISTTEEDKANSQEDETDPDEEKSNPEE